MITGYYLSIINFRLAATEVMKMLESAYQFEEDPYGRMNLEDLIKETQSDEKKANQESQSTSAPSDSSEDSPLKVQIQAIKVYLTYLLLQCEQLQHLLA